MLHLCLYALSILLGFALLVKGSDYFVDGAAGVATRFRIPQLIIGLTIVAMGTSAPEAAVSITAALEGSADITIGNIVGSNILNVFIILGLSAIIVPITIKESTIKYEIPYMTFCTVVLLILGIDGTINRFDGIVFGLGFVLYLIYLFICASRGKKEDDNADYTKGWKQFLFIFGGIIGIIIGSKLVVFGGSNLAECFGISERFIGLTVVALGTSLPELFTSVTAAKKGNADIAIGNIVGSNIFNILFVVGITALITDVPFDSRFIVDSVIAIASCLVLFFGSVRRKKLTRTGGIIMLACYVAYFIYICMV